jgi:hypothetical protein
MIKLQPDCILVHGIGICRIAMDIDQMHAQPR